MVTLKSRIWKLKSRNRILLFLAGLLSLTTILWAQGEFKARKIVSSTALELQAGGTDQNITLTPSGTGFTILNGNVGINTSSPALSLDAYPFGGSGAGVFASRGFSDTAGTASAFVFYRARGTATGPTAAQAGDALGMVSARAYNGSEFPSTVSPRMIFLATENQTPTAQGSKIIFSTTPNGSVTRADRLTIDQDGAIIAARRFVAGVNSVTFSATPTFDASLGNTQKITLTGNVTSSTLSNATAGQALYFLICQDATGARTFVWPTNVQGATTIGSTASTCTAQSFVFDGTNAYALAAGVINQ
jgi:hypothetical protein